MNKQLEELSKPVAYTADCGNIVSDSDPFFDDYRNPQPLYSQEYVSALLQRSERLDAMLTESVQDLKAAEKRIAELEEKYSEVSGWYVKMKTRMLSAEKRLATPVRLPQRCRCEGYHIDEAYLVDDDEGDCYDRDEVIDALREQGFKVEGDV